MDGPRAAPPTAPTAGSGRRRDLGLGLAGAAITGIWAASAAVRRPAPPRVVDPSVTLTVLERTTVARDQNVVALRLGRPDGGALPRWHPGAHLDIALPSGRLRQYSLCGDPAARTTYRIAVRRIPSGGGGSVEVHDSLPIGSTVTTTGPRNAFPFSVPGHGSPARRVRFVAGGIGITPILPMLSLADRMGVDWSMVYTGRSLASIPFVEEVRRFGARVQIRTDDRDDLPSADDLLGECPTGTAVYLCGPPALLTAVRDRLADRVDVELHFERFAAPPVVGGEAFTAVGAVSGIRVEVGPDETLLAALQRAGVPAAYSCRQGFCGTCRTGVLSGAVDHRDTLLTAPERAAGTMLTCVSRGAADETLLLDL